MTNGEWLNVVKVLNVMYEDKDRLMFESAEKINVWFSCLKDLDYEVVSVAVKRIASKSKYRPSIADIREECVEITHGGEMLPESQAWDMVRMALRDSYYHADEQFARLPEIVQRAVVSPSRLTEWGQLSSDTVGSVVRAEFRRAYEQAQNSVREERQMGEMGKGIAQKLAEQLRIDTKTANPDAERKYIHTRFMED